MNEQTRPHLHYIDGIRACACLYVVLHHAYLYLNDGVLRFPKLLDFIGIVTLTRGHDAVVIFSDYLLIGFISCLIVRFHSNGEGQAIIHWLSHRQLNFIGHFSYSIYLIHDPVLRILYLVQAGSNWGFWMRCFWMIVIGTSISIGAGYLMYLAVERHFISHRP